MTASTISFSRSADSARIVPFPGRTLRRRSPSITRHQTRAFWADLMTRRAETREDAARIFGVTFQTACNWFDGFVVPSGDKVLIAIELWPEEFGLVREARAAA